MLRLLTRPSASPSLYHPVASVVRKLSWLRSRRQAQKQQVRKQVLAFSTSNVRRGQRLHKEGPACIAAVSAHQCTKVKPALHTNSERVSGFRGESWLRQPKLVRKALCLNLYEKLALLIVRESVGTSINPPQIAYLVHYTDIILQHLFDNCCYYSRDTVVVKEEI